jgi:hypothetical protein
MLLRAHISYAGCIFNSNIPQVAPPGIDRQICDLHPEVVFRILNIFVWPVNRRWDWRLSAQGIFQLRKSGERHGKTQKGKEVRIQDARA